MNGYELVRKQATQDQEIDARLPLAGGTMTGSILVGNNTSDIGADANRFRNGYFSKLYTNVNAGIDVGNWNLSGANNYLQITDTVANDIKFQWGPSYAQFYTTARPFTNGAYDLGEYNLAWRGLYTVPFKLVPGGNDYTSDIVANRSNFRIVNNINEGIDYSAQNKILNPTVNNTIRLGSTNYRFAEIWSTVGNIGASDIKLKTNIVPITNNKTKNISNEGSKYYNFVKDLPFYEYDYNLLNKANRETFEDNPQLHNIGFIAQDICDTEIGKKFIFKKGDSEEYNYSNMAYVGVLGVALQETINKLEEKDLLIESLKKENQQLKDDIKLIKEKLAI